MGRGYKDAGRPYAHLASLDCVSYLLSCIDNFTTEVIEQDGR